MALTRFPIETDQPTIEVILPVGTHILELVVEDSAGLRSAPDTVTITVRAELPEITGISPDGGRAGDTVEVTIAGRNLEGATGVSFSGEGISGEILPGGTDESLPVRLVIDATAAATERTFTVTTAAGSSASPADVVFTIQAGLAQITGISPISARAGDTVEVTIAGRNLEGATGVSFSGEGISGEILPGGTDESLPVRLVIDATAAATERTFTVTTPAGTAESPADLVFTVTAVELPEITGISPVSGVQRSIVDATITGANLLGAREVTFSGTGIAAQILRGGTSALLPVRLTISGGAPTGARSFTVVTARGTAVSPRGVVFNVVLLEPIPVPTLEPIPVPTREPVPVPTLEPIPVPTREPIPVPTLEPIPVPTREPIPVPTVEPIPVPTRLPTPTRFEPIDFPGRTVTEVSGIGPTLAERLEASGVTNLAELASMEPARVSEALGVSEVRAMTFVDEARRLLEE
jgi:hypothetical protein